MRTVRTIETCAAALRAHGLLVSAFVVVAAAAAAEVEEQDDGDDGAAAPQQSMATLRPLGGDGDDDAAERERLHAVAAGSLLCLVARWPVEVVRE